MEPPQEPQTIDQRHEAATPRPETKQLRFQFVRLEERIAPKSKVAINSEPLGWYDGL
jgi:hypothetical protein